MSSPTNNLQAKVAGLNASEKDLYRAILLAFPELGQPPTREWLQAKATALGIEADVATSILADDGLIEWDPTTGAILAAYPFSATPTPHRVELAGAQPVYAMCAVDALGIPFMLGRDAIVISQDPISGGPIQIIVRGAETAWNPQEAVVFVCAPSGASCSDSASCTQINFFRSIESADVYRRTYPEMQGCVLSQAEAVAYGRTLFGNLLVEHEPVPVEGTPLCSCCR